MASPSPEEQARIEIDRQLEESGWVVQNRDEANLSAGRGVAIREFMLERGHGFADYLLFVDGKAAGVLEAKREGFPLSGVEVQAETYSEGLPDALDAPLTPLPFCYLSTGKETWLSMTSDVKGDAYEGLLERNAQDTKSGAGQYFTPRGIIDAIIDCVQPQSGEIICDPACGTGGFLLSAASYIAHHHELDRDQKKHLRYDAVRGVELVDGVSRLCAMNLFLHGIGPDDDEREPPVRTDDSLRSEPGDHYPVVVTNPPFGKKSSITVVNEAGETDKRTVTYSRPDFWTTTTNKQLNFVQHIRSLLAINGRAAVVLPDNVLFEGGAGETVRRKLMDECELHTVLRLPTGIFYAQGVKANVLFFDRRPARETPWTREVWFYDLRTNKHFTLKQNRLTRADLDEFVECYRPGDRHNRTPLWSEKNPDGRWRRYTHDEIVNRDKASLDIFWLRDDSLEDSNSLPDPHILAAEIAEDLEAALDQIKDILGDLETRVDG